MGSVGARRGGGIAVTVTPQPQPIPNPNPPSNNSTDNQDLDSWRAMSNSDAAQYAYDAYDEFNQQSSSDIQQQGMNPRNHLQALVEKLNLHDKPVVLSDADYDNQWKANALNGVEIYRGVGYRTDDMYQQQFLYGDKTFISDGIHGEGIYFATSSNYAASYAGKPEINTVTGFIDKSKANVVTEDAISTMFLNEPRNVRNNFTNIGAYALYKGYNVIHVPGGNMGSNYSYGKGRQSQGYGDFYMPLTRGVMVVREHTRLRTRP